MSRPFSWSAYRLPVERRWRRQIVRRLRAMGKAIWWIARLFGVKAYAIKAVLYGWPEVERARMKRAAARMRRAA